MRKRKEKNTRKRWIRKGKLSDTWKMKNTYMRIIMKEGKRKRGRRISRQKKKTKSMRKWRTRTDSKK